MLRLANPVRISKIVLLNKLFYLRYIRILRGYLTDT